MVGGATLAWVSCVRCLGLLCVLVLAALPALAVTPGNGTILNESFEGRYNDTSVSENASIHSGNSSQLNLTMQRNSYRWAGIFGNVTGTLVIGDADRNALYQWNAQGNLVYATQGVPDWTNLSDAQTADVTSAFPYLDEPNSSDRYELTFTGATENIGSRIFSLTSDYATATSTGSTVWKTYSIMDSTNIIFVGRVNRSETRESFRGGTIDFQMIVPEDGSEGDATPTTYNLYVELI